MQALAKGVVTTGGGRQLMSTGKVVIGIAHQKQTWRDQGSQADMWQKLLTAPAPLDEWHETPRVFYVSRPWWKRVLMLD